MSRFSVPGLDRISVLPSDVLAALRLLPKIVENTGSIKGHTAALAEVRSALEEVKADTEALPAVRRDMRAVAEATSLLEGMDRRMGKIEEAMPVLVEVQKHLDALPETMERLDQRIKRLSGLMESILVALEALNSSVDSLQGAVEPMGRLASRVPGQKKA